MPLFNFDNSYARLPKRAYMRLAPERPVAPRLVRFNGALAESLGIHREGISDEDLGALLSGQRLPKGSEPLAQAYAGHQFGHFQRQLGDGRAHLLGEHVTPDGRRFDIMLKGSGQTAFSRRGDGKAALGPMMREYVISEALAGLGIPTTRSLALVLTGESVVREAPLPGAVLTRVAASHIRVGTLQYFAARGDGEMVALLVEETLRRHYPDRLGDENHALALFHAVAERQARLVARWMGVGFIHGVMNTDNMALCGESIDFGPCAFLDDYHPDMVFSAIDSHGRYAYGNQGRMAQWNLARLAECLLPFFHTDEAKAMDLAQQGLERFAMVFGNEWLGLFGRKIGLARAGEHERPLINRLLTLMEAEGADFTATFRALAEDESRLGSAFGGWLKEWRLALQAQEKGLDAAFERMQAENPAIIARNHRLAQAIEAGTTRNDFTLFDALVEALKQPFRRREAGDPLLQPPTPEERVRQTFCGT